MVPPVASTQEYKRHQQKSGKHSERDEAKVRWRQNDRERGKGTKDTGVSWRNDKD